MQTLRSVDISKIEWRWVIIISGFLVALTLVPYAWALASNQADDDWQFLGMLANAQDGATYLAKIQQGERGRWLFTLRHTPEIHDGAGFHTFYILLGHIARITGLSGRVVFHLARVATSFFMFLSFYQLGATIWVRLRPRRLFFTFLSVGSGLGWLWLLLAGAEKIPPDMLFPEAFPFFAAYANPHFPLSIACLSLIASIFIVVFRRGFNQIPTADNGGLALFLMSMLLALIQPTVLVPISSALVLYVGVRYYLTRETPYHELRWASMLWLPVIPFMFYDYAVFRFNDIMGQFNEQNITRSPAPYLYLVGYGLLLIVAIPGLVRAVRRFERDGDQLMLLWFVINVIGLYAPFNLQRRLSMGLIIPLVYFDVRALEDYWFYRVPEKWRAPALIALIVFIVPSNVLNLGIPLFGAVFNTDSGLENGLLLETDYWNTFDWFRDNAADDAVVLASPNVSLWIPAYTNQLVVYGHPYETVPNDVRLEQVKTWYRGEDCETLLSDDLPFHVRFIMWGPQEEAFARGEINVSLETENDGEETENEDIESYPNAGKCIQEIPEDRIEDRVIIGEVTTFVIK
jgi:hypothetical protein